MDRIINNAIESRSEFLLEDIKEKSKYYAVTENHQKAINKLEESHIIIIAGEPGIGKTTLAEHLALWYIEKEYKFYNIENSINEAESIYKRDEKQIFYFDDFLGANYLNAIEDKKDSHIVKFMDRIKKDKTKRFILTSRTNIFNQSLALSDTFRSKNIENEEFIIKIESLKGIDKAHILYNHIWHSDLDEEFIDEIYVEKRYKEIIKHKNFNPRLIAFITDSQKIQKEQIKAENYWNYIVEKLTNPQDIWKNTFDKQSDEFTRAIVMLTVFNGNKIEEDKLRDSYYRYIELAGLTSSSHTSKEFDSIIEEVVKYFLNRNQSYSKRIEYSLFNPSIADFVINKYKDNKDKLIVAYFSLSSVQALTELSSLKAYGKVDEQIYIDIVSSIYENFDVNNLNNIDYKIKLLKMYEFINLRSQLDITKRNAFFQNIIDNTLEFTLIDEFVTTLTYIELEDIRMDNNDFILQLIENASLDENDINKIIELLKHFDIHDKNIDNKLNKLIHEYLENELDSWLSQLEIDDVEFENDKDGLFVRDGDIEEYIYVNIDTLIHGIDKYEAINIDRDAIADTVNIEDINYNLIDAYMEAFMEESYEHKDIVSSNKIDSIEDLFER